MACANYWNSPIQVGDQHLARKFVAAGWEVAYVSAPISPLHWLARTPDRVARLQIYQSGGQRDLDGRLFHYVPAAPLVYHDRLVRSAWLMRNWARLSFPNLTRVLAKNSFERVDLLYIRDVRQAGLLDAVPHTACVYRIADRDAAFGRESPALRSAEQEVARRADIVVYTAPNLRDYVAQMQPKRMHFLPNGVDSVHFATARPRPADLQSIVSPIAIYVGSLDFWFDFELIEDAARALPEVAFVVVGPQRRAEHRLTPRPNLHVLGPRPYETIPAYLQAASAGLIPFDTRRHADLVNAINPIKLYEYAASGLPCVATDWEALRELNTPAILTRDAAEFIAAVRRTIEQPPPRETLLEFARANDWNARFQELEALLTPLLDP